jgi:cobalamin synthase
MLTATIPIITTAAAWNARVKAICPNASLVRPTSPSSALLKNVKVCSAASAALWLPYSPRVVLAGSEGRMSTWPVLACVAGIILTYVFRVLFARWYYRRCGGGPEWQ